HQLPTDQLQFAAATSKKKSKAKTKTDTKLSTLKLFKAGNSIEDIARHRDLTPTTISSHLAYFVGKGELDVFTFVDKRKVETAAAYFAKAETKALSEARQQLGDGFSYAELRMVLEYMRSKKRSEQKD
ncbi:MAG: helix-turn-helix domain-containing protein, partial [Bacteroidota bacterium]